MRVEPINIIRITGKTGTADPFADIRKGSEVSARILERLGGKEALLEIGGKRIRAEFLKGLPAGSAITLRLDGIRDNSYMFRMVDPSGRDALFRQVLETTIFAPRDLPGTVLHNLGTALARTPAGILELNALLLGMRPKREKQEEGPASLLNRLSRLGVRKEALAGLSAILSAPSFDREAIRAVLAMFVPGGHFRGQAPEGDEIAASINTILRDIDTIPETGPRNEIIGRMLSLLAEHDDAPEGYRSGEFAFRDGEEYSTIRYLASETSWVFSMDLSNIGRTDVLAKKEQAGYSISVFSESEEAAAALKKSSGMLRKNLDDMPGGIYINFYITRHALNKIVEIYSQYSLHSVFDTKA